jgi:hypothetical protein
MLQAPGQHRLEDGHGLGVGPPEGKASPLEVPAQGITDGLLLVDDQQ